METVKGFKDYTGDEAVKRRILKDFLVENFEKYGFEPAETPVIEEDMKEMAPNHIQLAENY